MNDLTFTQRILRGPINWVVERYFPLGMFYGKEYLKVFDKEPEDTHPLSVAAMYLIVKLREEDATSGDFKFINMTSKGKPVGSWRLQITEIEENK